MSTGNSTKPRGNRFGVILAVAIIVAAVCVAVLFYIGWFNNRTHVDTPGGDNVMEDYTIETAHPDAPGENDWENPEHSNLQQVVVDHAEGTDTTPAGE